MAKSKLSYRTIMSKKTSIGLPAGIHENVFINSMDAGKKTNEEGVLLKKHFYIDFKQIDKDNNISDAINVSFFRIDCTKESALYNLGYLLKRIKEIAELYMTEEQFYKNFDPLKVLLEEGEDENDEDVYNQFNYSVIRDTRLEITSNYTVIEDEAVKQIIKALKNKIGEKSPKLRIKLVKNEKSGWIEIPRFQSFVELMSTTKKDSKLYNNQ